MNYLGILSPMGGYGQTYRGHNELDKTHLGYLPVKKFILRG